MSVVMRRHKLLNRLKNTKVPITGAEFALEFRVSRQVVVQDIAILRAQGEQILATTQGYLIPLPSESFQAVVACRHTMDEIASELGIMVDLGAKVLDVIVEHPLYGEMRGNLMIASRRDLTLFMERLEETAAYPLSSLTGGVHLHTLEIPDLSVLAEIRNELAKSGFIVN